MMSYVRRFALSVLLLVGGRLVAAAPDPAEMSRRIGEQFLSTVPEDYSPKGFRSVGAEVVTGYGKGQFIHYATVSLWLNAIRCAHQRGDRDQLKRLIDAFEPYYGEKAGILPKFKHVDFTIVGALPLEIARLTGDPRAKALGLKYADMQWECPKPDDPPPLYNPMTFEERMSWWKQGYSDQTRLWIDDAYMITVLQSQAYLVTGDRKYIERAAKEMCLYLDRIQLKDGKDAGLFYHAPDVPYVWGRGDGWMAAGMPIVMKHLGKDSPYFAKIMAGYRKMMAVLLTRQNDDGMWNQLVGDTSSWKETSCTAMFAYAFLEGVQAGWLDDATYGAAARKAYAALCERIDEYGNLADVCCGTAKKNDHSHYLNRSRVNGDPHGQATFLWLCGSLMNASHVALDARYLTEDRPTTGPDMISHSEALVFRSGGDEIYGQLLRPNAAFGDGRPVVIFAHGFAGFTRMDDVAQALCRAGCVAIVPHHRGAWGSQGKYSVANVIDDIVNLVDHVSTDEFVQKYRINPKAVFLCGHSMGGNTVLHAALRRPQVRGVVLQAPCDIGYLVHSMDKGRALEFLSDNGIDVLRTDGAETLYREIMGRVDELMFVSAAPRLGRQNVLLATGDYDHVVPLEPLDGFWTALGTNAAVRVRKTYPASHGFMGVRIAFAADVADFILKCL